MPPSPFRAVLTPSAPFVTRIFCAACTKYERYGMEQSILRRRSVIPAVLTPSIPYIWQNGRMYDTILLITPSSSLGARLLPAPQF